LLTVLLGEGNAKRAWRQAGNAQAPGAKFWNKNLSKNPLNATVRCLWQKHKTTRSGKKVKKGP
jgi:hypothetical protein